MRVLILHSSYSGGTVSGENRVVEEELQLLQNAGHQVGSYVPLPEFISPSERVMAGLSATRSQRAIRLLRRAVDDFTPDIVHLHNLFPSISPAAIRLFSRLQIPTVMTLHNYRLMCLPATFFRAGHSCELCLGKVPWRGVVLKCYRGSMPASAALGASITIHRAIGTFDMVDLLLPLTNFMHDKYVEAGVSKSKLMVKPNFAPARRRRVGAGSYFLHAGRLADYKGADLVARLGASTRTRIVVAGEGPLRGEIEAADGVTWLGALDPDALAEVIQSARAVLFPCRWYEGAPRIILEAYATGVPVIASDIGAIPEIVEHDKSGLLVSSTDKDAWLSAMERIEDDKESNRLGDYAYHLWETKYSPDQGLRNLEEAYRMAISRKSDK